jgi:hypothetical protein
LVANGVATCVKITNTSWIISGVGLSWQVFFKQFWWDMALPVAAV